MNVVSGKINLGKLAHIKMEVKSGKEKGKMVKGIFIPIANNNLFEGKEGALYLDIVGFELKEPKDFQTHLVKQSFPKELREEKKDLPIIGSLNLGAGNGTSDSGNDVGDGKTFAPDDDLPF